MVRFKKTLSFFVFYGLPVLFTFGNVYSANEECLAAFSKNPLTLEYLIGRSTRPQVDEVLQLNSNETSVLAKKDVREVEETFMKAYKAAITEIFEIARGRTVYLFARDGEWLYDAIQATLSGHSKGKELKNKFRLINVSRLISRNHTPSQLQTYLGANKMNLRAILNGAERVLWVDTGNRGSIFLNLYGAILDLIDFSKSQEEVKKSIINMITGIEGILISSRAEGNQAEIIQTVLDGNWNCAEKVAKYLSENLFFNEYLISARSDLGIPEDRHARYKWVVNHIEHTPHFQGRAKTLNAEGTEIATFELDPFAIKEASIGLQIRIIQYFSSESIKRYFKPIVDALLAEKEDQASYESGVEENAIQFKNLDPEKIKIGDWIKLPSKKLVKYLGPGGNGRRGIVLKVKDTSSRVFALKIAKDAKDETLTSLAGEVQKSKDAEKAGFRVPRIFESGTNFHLKEWVDGILASEWLKEWAVAGFKKDDPALMALKKLIQESSKRGLYTGDLNRKNLIWSDEWIVVDSGSTTSKFSTSEVLSRYVLNISKRWAKELDPSVENEFRNALLE